MTATRVTTGAYSARKAHFSWAISSDARYPSAMPAMIPITDCSASANSDDASESGALPVAADNRLNVRMADTASLNADSLITVCATRSRMRSWRKIGNTVAGHVAGIED